MTDDVVAFLRAAHERLERVARAAIAGLEVHGHAADPATGWWEEWWAESDHVVAPCGGGVTDDLRNGRLAEHIALHDPRSALARVHAERAILREHSRYEDEEEAWLAKNGYDPSKSVSASQSTCTSCGDVPQVEWPCQTVLLLAYGHRHTVSGWQETWTPQGVTAEVG